MVSLLISDTIGLFLTPFCVKFSGRQRRLFFFFQGVIRGRQNFVYYGPKSYKIKRYSGVPPLSERKREKTSKRRFELRPLAILLNGFLIFLIDFRQFRFASSFRFIVISHLPSCQYYLLRSCLLCDKLSFSGTTNVAAMTIFLFHVPISQLFLSNVP